MSLGALIVDDERLARKRLRELLSRHPEIAIVGEAGDMDGAVDAETALRPDVIFLDVDLSPGNGLDLLPRLSGSPTVVFVTAHESFAVQAFAVTAFDYLLKPVNPDRLAQTVQRLLTSVAAKPPVHALPGSGEAPLRMQDRVSLKDGGNVKVVDIGRIAAIEAAGAYSRVLLRALPPMLVLRSISDWEKALPVRFFLRLDRSLIIQLSLLQSLETLSRDETQLTLNGVPSPLLLGRVATRRLKNVAPSFSRPTHG